QIASNRFLMVGTGQNIKSISYVGNVAAFIVHVLFLRPGTHIFNYSDHPDMTTWELVDQIRRSLNLQGPIRQVPLSAARMAGRAFDVIARVSGRSFPISAIRITKFTENTQIRAERARLMGFVPPYSLTEGLSRTVVSEFTKEQNLQGA